MRILLVEDYSPVRLAVAKKLRSEGYTVDETDDGTEARWFALENDYSLAILDIGLPNVSGLDLIADVRSRGNDTSILMMTARDSIKDRVAGLDAGADDYLVKPFALSELMARVRALVRRSHGAKSAIISMGDVKIDTHRRIVTRKDQEIAVTGKEYELLKLLMLNAGRIVTRTDAWEQLYETGPAGDSNVIDVFVTNLRKKLEFDGLPRVIETRRGHGFIIEKELKREAD
jgi:two-component system copper resistance phosphate regulon response regulator CusR